MDASDARCEMRSLWKNKLRKLLESKYPHTNVLITRHPFEEKEMFTEWMYKNSVGNGCTLPVTIVCGSADEIDEIVSKNRNITVVFTSSISAIEDTYYVSVYDIGNGILEETECERENGKRIYSGF
jgi:hypothetical protein